MLFQKILLPVDGSDNSRKAAEYARGIARTQNAEIVLFHAYHKLPMLLTGDGRKEVEGKLQEEAHELMAQYRSIFDASGAKYEEVIVEGDPADSIVQTADELKCDAIVIGSRGHSDLEGLLMGSVAHKVLHVANCPVLVIR